MKKQNLSLIDSIKAANSKISILTEEVGSHNVEKMREFYKNALSHQFLSLKNGSKFRNNDKDPLKVKCHITAQCVPPGRQRDACPLHCFMVLCFTEVHPQYLVLKLEKKTVDTTSM